MGLFDAFFFYFGDIKVVDGKYVETVGPIERVTSPVERPKGDRAIKPDYQTIGLKK